jgi:outer membrane protein assembly factor BamB
VSSALIDLDSASAVRHRPGRSGPRARSLLAVLSVALLAVIGPAAPWAAHGLRSAVIPAVTGDGVFVSGSRLYVVDLGATIATSGGDSASGTVRRMRVFRLPGAHLLTTTELPLPEPVTGVLPVGDTTLVQSTVGGRPMIMAIDSGTGANLWWQFGVLRGAGAGVVLMTDDLQGSNEPYTAVDLRTGSFRWEVSTPLDGLLTATDDRVGDLPRWLVGLTADDQLSSYDTTTGRRIATIRVAPFGPPEHAMAAVADGLVVTAGEPSGVTAYALPGLALRWQIPTASLPRPVDYAQSRLQPGCGVVLCAYWPQLTALDPATGRVRWSSDRWNDARPLGSYLVVNQGEGAPDQVALTAVDPATGRARGTYGGWHWVFPTDGVAAYAVHPGDGTAPTLFGRFDADRPGVRILGSTEDVFGHCDAGAGSVVCHLTDGPVAVWDLEPK